VADYLSQIDLSQVMAMLLREIHEAQDLEHVLDRILREAVRLLNADRGDFAMVNDHGGLRVAAVIVTTEESLRVGDTCPPNCCMQHVYDRPEKDVLIDDVDRLRELGIYHCSDPNMKREAAVRFEFRSRRKGVLNIESSRPDAFGPEDARTLQRLADYAVVALQVFEEETRLRRLVERVLTHTHPDGGNDLSTILKEILRVVEEVHLFGAGLIYIADDRNHRLDVRGWLGRDETEFHYDYPERSFACRIREMKKPDFVADVEQSEPNEVNRRGMETFRIKGSLIGMPLLFRDQCVGVLVCWSDGDARPSKYHEAHLEPLATLAAWKIGVWQEEERRKEAEASHAKQFELFESLARHLPFCVFRKNLNHEFTYANAEFLKHLGVRSFDEVKGKTDYDFYPDHLARKFQSADQKVIDGESLLIDESNQLRGSKRTVRVRGFKAAIINQETHRPEGVQGMFWNFDKHEPLGEQKTALLRSMRAILDLAVSDREVDEYDQLQPHLDALAEVLKPTKRSVKSGRRPPPVPPPPPSDDCAAVLRALRKCPKGYASNETIRRHMTWGARRSIDDKATWIFRRLRELEQGGLVERDGSGTHTRWRLTDKGRRAMAARPTNGRPGRVRKKPRPASGRSGAGGRAAFERDVFDG